MLSLLEGDEFELVSVYKPYFNISKYERLYGNAYAIPFYAIH